MRLRILASSEGRARAARASALQAFERLFISAHERVHTPGEPDVVTPERMPLANPTW
jgi:hypothetical protein